MRGQGRVYRPKVRGEPTAVWWLDYSVNGRRYRESSGKTTKTEAGALLPQRIEDRKVGRAVQAPVPGTLRAFVDEHLKAKRESGLFTATWLDACRRHLDAAVKSFGGARHLGSITVADVRAWATALQLTMSGGSARHHLNSLSNLYRRAQAEQRVTPGYNPVAALMEKPKARRVEARWLEVPDASLLLEAARMYRPERSPKGGRVAMPFAHELLATFLLTGGRESEVSGLEVGDVSFDRKTITFRPNEWRRLKTATSFRVVPLWPQLEKILRPYVFNTHRPPSRLLFPSYRTGAEAMLTDFRKLLDAVAMRAGWKVGEIRSKMFRHTYCAARLQTLDAGAPVSVYTVAKELGHGGEAMVRKVYGHLGQVRHRAKVVEYRVRQHRAKLGDRLTRLRDVRQTNRQTKRSGKVVSR